MTGILGAPREWVESSPTRWYLVWCSSRRRHWWDRIFRTPEGFQHVYALRWDGWNWIMFNPTVAYTDVAIVDATDETALARLLDAGATCLEVEAFREEGIVRGRWWVGPMTCVEQVKALLGLPVGWIFTPWQLYRYLTREIHNGQRRRWRWPLQQAGQGRDEGKGGREEVRRFIVRPVPGRQPQA